MLTSKIALFILVVDVNIIITILFKGRINHLDSRLIEHWKN